MTRSSSLHPFTSKAVPHALRVGALLLLGALPAAAQEIKLDLNTRTTIEKMMDSLRALGLSDSVLRSKTFEGIQKRVDTKRLVEGVRAKFNLLLSAYSVLGTVDAGELDAASSVLAAGAKPNQLAAFKPRQKGRSDLVALTIWADLLSRGVPAEDASSAIAKLWQEGAEPAVFRRLWSEVQGDISQGLSPGAAFQARVRETPPRPTKPVTPPEG